MWRFLRKVCPWCNKVFETWTERDVLKQQFADKNNLNYYKFYTLETCIEWINNL